MNTETKPQHSPLPWKANSQGVWAKDAIYHSKDDTHEAVLWEAQEPYANKNADAAFIVQSVNRAPLFEEMLIAVKDYAFDLVQLGHYDSPVLRCLNDLIARAEAVQEGK